MILNDSEYLAESARTPKQNRTPHRTPRTKRATNRRRVAGNSDAAFAFHYAKGGRKVSMSTYLIALLIFNVSEEHPQINRRERVFDLVTTIANDTHVCDGISKTIIPSIQRRRFFASLSDLRMDGVIQQTSATTTLLWWIRERIQQCRFKTISSAFGFSTCTSKQMPQSNVRIFSPFLTGFKMPLPATPAERPPSAPDNLRDGLTVDPEDLLEILPRGPLGEPTDHLLLLRGRQRMLVVTCLDPLPHDDLPDQGTCHPKRISNRRHGLVAGLVAPRDGLLLLDSEFRLSSSSHDSNIAAFSSTSMEKNTSSPEWYKKAVPS